RHTRSDRDWSSDVCSSDLDLGLRVRDDIVGSFTTRVAHGYPIYRVGYETSRDLLLSAVAKYPNLLTGGRQGLFRYIFLDAAMEKIGRASCRERVEVAEVGV